MSAQQLGAGELATLTAMRIATTTAAVAAIAMIIDMAVKAARWYRRVKGRPLGRRERKQWQEFCAREADLGELGRQR